MMTPKDSFADLARYYDPLMSHVDYERWFLVTTELAALLPDSFRHLDACCGTGCLLDMLRDVGWDSVGIDLSSDMLYVGHGQDSARPLAVADLRALPFQGSVDYITCLFDSVNFLLAEEDLRAAFREFSAALGEGGILYFDIVTERMVTKHFEGQTWEEDHGTFKSTWSSTFDRETKIANTEIRLSGGATSVIRERIYTRGVVEEALSDAGFQLLGSFDAKRWKRPRRGSTRVDFVAVKGDAGALLKNFEGALGNIRLLLS
jgi:SAM-dependent methyltransferase